MKVNINDIVKVKLTEYGLYVLKQEEKKTNELIAIAILGHKYVEPVTQDGYYKCSLWKLFSVFGNNGFNGGRQVFCDNELEFNQDLADREVNDNEKVKGNN